MILQNENGKNRLKMEISDIPHDMEDYVRISPPPRYGFQFDSELFREQVADAIDDFKPDVFLLDPWNQAARRTAQEDYLDALHYIQSVMPACNDKPAIGIIAHTRKPRQEERHSGRALLNMLAGSYILGSVPRTVWILQAASDAGEDTRVIWTCCKNNDGDLGPRSAWVRQNGLFQPLPDFDWVSFDGEGVRKLSWQDVPAILKDGACGVIAKSVAIEQLRAQGIAQATAYRYLDRAIEAGLLKAKDGYIQL